MLCKPFFVRGAAEAAFCIRLRTQKEPLRAFMPEEAFFQQIDGSNEMAVSRHFIRMICYTPANRL